MQTSNLHRKCTAPWIKFATFCDSEKLYTVIQCTHLDYYYFLFQYAQFSCASGFYTIILQWEDVIFYYFVKIIPILHYR
uniref:Uncharacterized protein n=1 Tax=Anguilla anguilla TaxID=7936 RepID=A0A0E9TD35_ANGAN